MKKKRPEIVSGTTKEVLSGCGPLYVTVNEVDGKPFEVFINMGKAGGCASAQTETAGRLISLSLRSFDDPDSSPVPDIVKQLKGVTCHNALPGKEGVKSCADAVARRLAEIYGVKIDETIGLVSDAA